MVMAGLSFQSLRRHKALIPLFAIVGTGMVGAVGYLGRLAIKSPDVCWDKKNNPTPWDKYSEKQYKFMNITQKYEDPRPKF